MDMRIAGQERQTQEIIDRAMMQMNTCIPGLIDSFDEATQTASVRPAILMRTNVDGEKATLALPQLLEVPLVFPFASTAGFALTLPVKKDDPCLIFFSQRAIDNWHQLGGIQPPEDASGSRHHDITDAFVMLAPSPLPQVLGSWQLDGIELRNRARDSFVKVMDTQIVVETTDVIVNSVTSTVNATQSVEVNADTVAVNADTSATVTSPTVDVNATDATITATTSATVSAPSAGVSAGAATIDADTADVTATTSASIISPVINIGSSIGSLKKLVTDAFVALFNTHVHNETGTTTTIPVTGMTATHLTSTLKAD